MSVFGDLYPAYEEYRKTHLRGNASMYDWANDTQLRLVQQYMRLRSKLLFNRLTSSSNYIFSVNPAKAMQLAELSGGAQDWEYSGCVDTGYMGGGECTLGHSLRYEHYARSISTGSELIFGSKCASDFFKIPTRVLNIIKKSQDDLVDELKVIPFILNTGRYDQWVSMNYPDFAQLVDEFGADAAKSCFGVYCSTMVYFWKARIPWTPYLIGIFNNAKFGKYQQLRLHKKRSELALQLSGGDPEIVNMLNRMDDYGHIHYVKLVNAYIASEGNGQAVEALAVRKRLVTAAFKMCKVYSDVSELLKASKNEIGTKQFSFKVCDLADKAREQIWVVATPDYKPPEAEATSTRGRKAIPKPKWGEPGIRLATTGEIKVLSPRLAASYLYPIGLSKYRALAMLAWAMTGNTRQYQNASFGDGNKEELEKLVESIHPMEVSISWAESEQFKKNIQAVIEYKGTVYPESDPDEGKLTGKPITVSDMANYLEEHHPELDYCRDNSRKRQISMAMDIASRWMEKPDWITKPQILAMKIGYDAAREYLGDSMYDDPDEGAYINSLGDFDTVDSPSLTPTPENTEISEKELVQMATLVTKEADSFVKSTGNRLKFELQVCSTVKSKKHCSPKQSKFVTAAYDALYDQMTPEQQAKNPMSKMRRMQASVKGVQSSRGFGPNVVDVEEEAYNEVGGPAKKDVTVDLDALKRKKGIPTITEISAALGAGMFNELK